LQSVEFDIDREFVGRIVGSHGASVNRLRDTLGVKIDFSDDGDDFKDAKKKKTVSAKSHVKIVGRKENVEEAKRRILSQVDKLVRCHTSVTTFALVLVLSICRPTRPRRP
jgi:polyribonucleotide nucleotidyltransferase